MSTIQQDLKQLFDIWQEAAIKAAPLEAKLGPYLEAWKLAAAGGATMESSAIEIAQAILRGENFTPPAPPNAPQILDPNSSAQIDEKTAKLVQIFVSGGAAIGKVLGAAVGML